MNSSKIIRNKIAIVLPYYSISKEKINEYKKGQIYMIHPLKLLNGF
jgi:hypothetical protein